MRTSFQLVILSIFVNLILSSNQVCADEGGWISSGAPVDKTEAPEDDSSDSEETSGADSSDESSAQ